VFATRNSQVGTTNSAAGIGTTQQLELVRQPDGDSCVGQQLGGVSLLQQLNGGSDMGRGDRSCYVSGWLREWSCLMSPGSVC